MDRILYICILIDFQCAFSIFKMVLSFSVCICLYHVLVMQMAFYGFADGACHHTLNLASDASVFYSLAESPYLLAGIFHLLRTARCSIGLIVPVFMKFQLS